MPEKRSGDDSAYETTTGDFDVDIGEDMTHNTYAYDSASYTTAEGTTGPYYHAARESTVDADVDTTYPYRDGDLTTPIADDYTTPIDYDATYESIVDDDVDTTYPYPDGDLTTPTDYDESTVKPGVDFGGAGGAKNRTSPLFFNFFFSFRK